MASIEKKTSKPPASTGSYSFSNVEHNFVRKKRMKASHHHEEVGGELNIVPYLDIVMNLIMFILVAQATMVALGVVDVTAPTYATAGPGPAPTPDPKKDLKLTIGIAQDGFYIAGKGAVLPGETEESTEITPDNVTKRPPTVPRRADGTYDYPLLTLKLRQIKTLYPDATELFLAADPNIPYEVIVKTLDHSREDSRGNLFPRVAFSKIN